MAVGFPAKFTHRLASSAASENATLIRDSKATLFKVRARNTTASIVRLKLYDKASTPSEADTPRLVIPLEPGQQLVDDYSYGEEFATGLAFRIVTGSADADDTAPAAGAVTDLNVSYS